MNKRKRILITGATGMVGSNVVEALNYQGHHLLLTPSREELDLLNPNLVNSYVKDKLPDLIIHCAGKVGGIKANINDKLNFLYVNGELGKNVIMAAFEHQVPELINLGSSCFYPKDKEGKIKESDLLSAQLEQTNEGYSIGKIYALKLCQYIDQSTNLNYKTLIPCNLYGKGDDFSNDTGHMIPAVIKRIHDAKVNDNKEVTMWGDGTARREFMFVGDLAKFIISIIPSVHELKNYMNVGLGYDYSILEYYEAIMGVIGFQGSIVKDISKPVGMKRKLLDTNEQEQLGFSPKVTLKEGLTLTYDFYKTLVHYED